MSRLADDCFRAGDDVITADEALRRIADWMTPVSERETAPLIDAAGRITAEDVIALADAPPQDNAAVDGYAVRIADLATDRPTRLPVALRLAAGPATPEALPAGAAARIFTGAQPPAGADAIVMQEDAALDAESRVTIPPGVKRGANIRPIGEDLPAGAVAIPAGRRLRPADLALAAAAGLDALPVRRKLRIGVFSTGDELVDPGAPRAAGRIYDANRVALLALSRGCGAEVEDLGRLPDDRAAVSGALGDAAARCDALATSGGMSQGEEDHIAAAISDAGGDLAFWRMAVKPGRPVALGRIGDCAVIGLPGNPTAAIVMFCVFGKPLLARLAGETPRPPLGFPLPAGFTMKKKAGRREYLRVRVIDDGDGPQVVPAGREGSGILTTLVAADGLWSAPEDWSAVSPGDVGLFRPFPELAL